jgi:hypothetical protein
MQYYLEFSYVIAFSIVLVVVPSAHSQSPSELQNIALGKTYSCQPQPGYQWCTDPDDKVQLTDGVYTDGYFWTQVGTVGWSNQRTIIVTIDLGSDQAIQGVSLRSAAGTAGVAWPSGIRILVAGDDKRFRDVGDLLALSAVHGLPEPQPYAVHRYWTDAMKTHGRYLAFVVTNQPYTFIDELEVYGGDPAWVSGSVNGPPFDDLADYVSKRQTWDGIARRLCQDDAVIRKRANAASVPAAVRSDALAALDSAVELAPLKSQSDYHDFRAVLPLNQAHQQQFSAQAALWRAGGIRDLVVWQSELWESLDHLVTPPRAAAPKIVVAMMNNEFRSASLNVSNPHPEDRVIHLSIQGLPDAADPEYVTVHEVAWTDTASGLPVASALPVAERSENGTWLIHVPAGMTRQIWFTLHPSALASGKHQGRVSLVDGDWTSEVPIALHVYPIRFPDKPTLSFGGWDYTDGDGHRGINPGNRDAVIRDLKAHFVDTPWATSAVMPWGENGADGHMVTPPDTTRFDEWVARWPDAVNYCIFAAVGERFGSYTMETPAFAVAVGDWARFWADHAKSKGIAPNRLCVLLLDEPHEVAQDQIIIAWATAIKAAGAGLTIWEDPTYHGVSDSQAQLVKVCDVLCPNRTIFLRASDAYRDFYRAERDQGTRLEFYACVGPTTLLDPYSYFRLQAWTCWKEGALASYFWAFGDNAGGSSWNEYVLPGKIYTLTYLDETSVTPAKMLEAAREGIEDYEYLVMLRAAIASAPAGPARKAAEAVMAALPDRVLESATSPGLLWHDKLDRSQADVVRIQILDALGALLPAP